MSNPKRGMKRARRGSNGIVSWSRAYAVFKALSKSEEEETIHICFSKIFKQSISAARESKDSISRYSTEINSFFLTTFTLPITSYSAAQLSEKLSIHLTKQLSMDL